MCIYIYIKMKLATERSPPLMDESGLNEAP